MTGLNEETVVEVLTEVTQRGSLPDVGMNPIIAALTEDFVKIRLGRRGVLISVDDGVIDAGLMSRSIDRLRRHYEGEAVAK